MDVADDDDDDDDSSQVNVGGGDGDGEQPEEHSAESKRSAPLDPTSPTEPAISTASAGERVGEQVQVREPGGERAQNRNEHNTENQRRTRTPQPHGKWLCF